MDSKQNLLDAMQQLENGLTTPLQFLAAAFLFAKEQEEKWDFDIIKQHQKKETYTPW